MIMEKLKLQSLDRPTGGRHVYLADKFISSPDEIEEEFAVTCDPEVRPKEKTATLSMDHGKYYFSLLEHRVGGVKKWRVRSVFLNLARILYKHNGCLILRDDQLHGALAIANQKLNTWVDQGGEDLLIPGLSPSCAFYVQYLEIANQVKDQGGVLLKRLKEGRFKYYDDDHLEYENGKCARTRESLYLGPPREPLIVAYRKDLEIEKRANVQRAGLEGRAWTVREQDRECLRLEVRVRGRKLINKMTGCSDAYERGLRLNTFTMRDVLSLYRSVLGELCGVFNKGCLQEADMRCQKATEAFLTKHPSLTRQGDLYGALAEFEEEHEYKANTIQIIRANLEEMREALSPISLDSVVPGMSGNRSMDVVPMRPLPSGELEPVFAPRRSWEHDERIVEAYSCLSTFNIHGEEPSLPSHVRKLNRYENAQVV